MLPRARRILDLGGTDLDNRVGSLVAMGYPYAFQQVTIVDLPHGDRHELYRRSDQHERVESHLGPVEYRYHSMADLSDYADASFDMVFSGESIEHITEAQARVMVHEVRRVLEPGGWFCLDTPNRQATEIELGNAYSNPDHKIEYTDAQLSDLLESAGFEITGRYGLAYVGESIAKGTFDGQEQARNHGVYADIEDCYLLAYICRAPTRI
jgi:SAM-dependent methyltransferase